MRLTGYRILLLCALLMPAFGPEAAAQRFIFTPQWTAQAQFAGYYVAQEMGFYKEAGIDVEIVHPTTTEAALDRVKKNRSQATTLQLAQALEIIDTGVPLVNILQTSMNNALVIVSRRGVDPLTQKGEKVGVWNVGFGQIAMSMSAMEGLDYEWVPISSNVNLFLAGALDATLAMSYNEYYQILQAGIELDDHNVYRFCDHGYNVQEDGVYVTQSYYLRHRDECRRFAEACRRGWEWAAEHPEETLDIVMKLVHENHIATNRVMQKLMLDEILRLQVDKDSGQREFRLRPDMVQKASSLMYDNGFILRELTYEEMTAR